MDVSRLRVAVMTLKLAVTPCFQRTEPYARSVGRACLAYMLRYCNGGNHIDDGSSIQDDL